MNGLMRCLAHHLCTSQQSAPTAHPCSRLARHTLNCMIGKGTGRISVKVTRRIAGAQGNRASHQAPDHAAWLSAAGSIRYIQDPC
jgi:hypothetical protein